MPTLNLDSTAIPWPVPGPVGLPPLNRQKQNRPQPGLATVFLLLFSCLHDSTDLLNFFLISSLVVQLPRPSGQDQGKSSIEPLSFVLCPLAPSYPHCQSVSRLKREGNLRKKKKEKKKETAGRSCQSLHLLSRPHNPLLPFSFSFLSSFFLCIISPPASSSLLSGIQRS